MVVNDALVTHRWWHIMTIFLILATRSGWTVAVFTTVRWSNSSRHSWRITTLQVASATPAELRFARDPSNGPAMPWSTPGTSAVAPPLKGWHWIAPNHQPSRLSRSLIRLDERGSGHESCRWRPCTYPVDGCLSLTVSSFSHLLTSAGASRLNRARNAQLQQPWTEADLNDLWLLSKWGSD